MRRRNREDRREITRYQNYEVHVVGGKPLGFEDAYHALIVAPWQVAGATVVGTYMVLNALFACLYLLVGGVSNVKGFVDAFFFSVQTMGTIGYGTMAPTTHAANTIVVLESVTGLVFTALATGIVFVRFSRTRAKVRFSSRAAICLVDGVKTLTLRVGNERRAPIADASIRMTATRTTLTKEGVTLYRAEQLPLVHDRVPQLTRALTLRHVIDEKSPFFSDTPETFAKGEIDIMVALSGTDEATLQPVHARTTLSFDSIVWGARLADVMSEPAPDRFELDLRRFDVLVPCEKTEDFPYSSDPDGQSTKS
jgi:inward rectifier potassium channel